LRRGKERQDSLSKAESEVLKKVGREGKTTNMRAVGVKEKEGS